MPKKDSVFIAFLGALIFLSGCQPAPYGVSRQFEITSEPSVQCVKDVISSTEGVTLVDVYDSEKSPSWTLLGERLPISHGYVYKSASISPAAVGLLIAANGSGKIRVDHYQLSSDEKLAQSLSAATRFLMKDVESKLASMCGAIMVESTLDERCHGCTLAKSSP